MNSHTMALRVRDVCVSLAGQEVLHDIDVSFVAGRWTSIVGPNGAGKSTLLKLLSRITEPTQVPFRLTVALRAYWRWAQVFILS